MIMGQNPSNHKLLPFLSLSKTSIDSVQNTHLSSAATTANQSQKMHVDYAHPIYALPTLSSATSKIITIFNINVQLFSA